MLKINNLSIKTIDKEIIKNLNLDIEDGTIHVIMGLNGAGKSTICKTILKDPNYQITNGTITYNDTELNNLTPDQISKLGIYLLNQNPLTIEGVTNLELIKTALSEQSSEQVNIFQLKNDLEQACEIINLPKEFINRGINDGMSGGEKKKNELLQMWLLKPSLILLDELDSGLDVDALKDVCNALNIYIKENHSSLLIITHHTNILSYLKPDYVHILNNGEIIKTGDITLANQIEINGFNGLDN